MKKYLQTTIILALSASLSGCAAVVAGTAATGVLIAQDRRTTGTIVDDQSIELKAKQAINQSLTPEEQSHINVISYNNHLLLLGQAPDENIRVKAEEAVRHVANVKTLHNELQIAAPTSLLTRSSDSWITTKIKSEMLVQKDFNPTRVKVITEDGVVYLLGIVNKKEEQRAVDIARHTKGVKRVVKMFEYMPS